MNNDVSSFDNCVQESTEYKILSLNYMVVISTLPSHLKSLEFNRGVLH